MKMINYILVLVIMFFMINLNAQCQIHIDTISFCYYNGITKQTQVVDNYQITNNTNEEYLTWMSLVPTNNKSNVELTNDFFKKRKGDFTLVEMMYEDLLGEQPVIIGYSFIKNVAVSETFSYFIAKKEPNSMFYQDRIVVLRRRDVERYLNMHIEQKYFFKQTSIFLNE